MRKTKKHTLMEKHWHVLPPIPKEFTNSFPELPPIVAALLYHRGIRTQAAIDEFLSPDYSDHVHDPYQFRDMAKAMERIFAARDRGEKITIHGDYDADGVSASVILSSLFRILSITHDVFLPHRETDGYGLNKKTVELLAAQGSKVIITCDCGISNVEEINLAQSLGMDVIVTDHHSIPKTLPNAFAIIHPKIEGETYPDKGLSGGGVAFKLAQALLKKHKETNEVLPNGDRHEAFEKWLLDMVAISSVADMVPLLGESRTLTKFGLLVLNKTRRIGLQKLLMEARLRNDDGSNKREITADTIGFHIAPRINAAGRMNHANVAYNLLITDDPIAATDLAFELDQNNQARQKMTDELVRLAVEQVERDQKDQPVLFVIGKGWATGIVGLIASRIKEMYQKPTIAMTEQTLINGSGRSITGFNLVESLQEMPEFFLKFGGHPMACGFTLKDNALLEPFKEALIDAYREKTTNADMRPILSIAAEIDLEQVNWDLFDILDKFKPFGQANEKPKYLARQLTVTGLEPVGQDGKHLRILVRHRTPRIRKMIGWNLCSPDRPNAIGKLLKIGDIIDIVFEIDVNEWNGNRELQMTIVDIKKNG